jgi:hypothetical protein
MRAERAPSTSGICGVLAFYMSMSMCATIKGMNEVAIRGYLKKRIANREREENKPSNPSK